MVHVNVLLVGRGDMEEIDLMADAVAGRGGETTVVDVQDWPSDEPLTFDPREEGATFGERIEFDEVDGAYVFPSNMFHAPELRFHESLSENLRPTLNQIREHHTMFESLCYELDQRGVEMIPPFRNHDWHQRKPWQIKLLEDEGVPVPDTLFTNDADAVLDFYENHEKVIYKPVTRSGAPKVLSDEDLTDERLEHLSTAPVQFQTFVPGEDLRIYFLDGEVVGGMRYHSDDFSFKLDMQEGKEIDVEAFDPPTEMRAAVETAAEESGLVFGGADVRLLPDGDFRVLELNDVPRFAAADLRAGQDVAGELADYWLDD